MAPTSVPRDDHVSRYVRKNRLRRDEHNNVVGILPQALELREGESFLSVTWLEHFADDYELALRKAANAIRRQLEVKPKDGFAVGGVGQICDFCESFDVRLRVLHEPEPPENTGHCAMRGLQRADLKLLELLAAEAFTDIRVAEAIPIDVR